MDGSDDWWMGSTVISRGVRGCMGGGGVVRCLSDRGADGPNGSEMGIGFWVWRMAYACDLNVFESL